MRAVSIGGKSHVQIRAFVPPRRDACGLRCREHADRGDAAGQSGRDRPRAAPTVERSRRCSDLAPDEKTSGPRPMRRRALAGGEQAPASSRFFLVRKTPSRCASRSIRRLVAVGDRSHSIVTSRARRASAIWRVASPATALRDLIWSESGPREPRLPWADLSSGVVLPRWGSSVCLLGVSATTERAHMRRKQPSAV